eukprot:gene58105-79583_t
MKTQILGTLTALAIVGAACAEPPPPPLRPAAISGWGWNVMDLEAQRSWYIDKLGMKVLRSYDRDGKPFEYILGYENAPAGSAILALLASPTRKPGPSTAGRIILR